MGAKCWSSVPMEAIYLSAGCRNLGGQDRCNLGLFRTSSRALWVPNQNGYALTKKKRPLRGAFRRVPYWFAGDLSK